MQHPLHREILREIEKQVRENRARYAPQGDAYIGSTKPCYMLGAATSHRIAREFVRRHADMALDDYACLLDSLSQGKTTNEIGFIGDLLQRMPRLRHQLDPRRVAAWLEHVQGWAETDGICQSTFAAEDLLSNWSQWRAQLLAMAKSVNVHQRRASLVLLTKPVRDSDDPRLARVAFANITQLTRDKDILITKAISWLLRALIQNHRSEVEAFLSANQDSLPRVAIRETRVKLQTGKKYSRRP